MVQNCLSLILLFEMRINKSALYIFQGYEMNLQQGSLIYSTNCLPFVVQEEKKHQKRLPFVVPETFIIVLYHFLKCELKRAKSFLKI